MRSSRIKTHSFSQWPIQITVKSHHMCPAKVEVARTSLGEFCKGRGTWVGKGEQCALLPWGSFSSGSTKYWIFTLYLYVYHCMTGEIGFCGGKFYFYFHGAKFWAKLSLSWWHTSLHLPDWRRQGAVPQQMVACYSTIQSLNEQQFYPHIWRGHSTLVLQRKSFICQEKLPESGMALLCHVMVLETWHSAWMTSMKSIQHLNTGFGTMGTGGSC